jgi:hypothetical protein
MVGIGLLAIIAVAVLWALGAIPLTTHAANGHTMTWNATNIKQVIQNIGCRQTQYFMCPMIQQARMLCVLPDGKAGQLIFGLRGKPMIVTGYSYNTIAVWQNVNRADGCIMVAANQFPPMLMP